MADINIRAPLSARVDHIFMKDAQAQDFKVLPHIGSDHFPIMADILIPSKN